VLSKLVESSISNFENDQSEEEMKEDGDDHSLNQVVANRNSIRIEKQASMGSGPNPHYNLKSRKSQKAAKQRKVEPGLANIDASQTLRAS